MNAPVIVRSAAKTAALHAAYSPIPSGPVEIGMVLDQSTSMQGYVSEVIAGYNTVLEEQKALSSETRVSLTLFGSKVRDLYQGRDILMVSPLSLQTYRPDGNTALYDGIMASINGLAARTDGASDNPRVVVAILSDGAENASTLHNLGEVKEAITYRQNVLGWTFLFLGPHASKTAYALGIPVTNALAITASQDGIKQALSRLKNALANIRLGNSADVFRLK